MEWSRLRGVRRMRIALDLDGVLANTMSMWVRLWRERTGREIRLEDFDEWSSWKYLGITEREFMEIMNEAWRRWRYLPPTEENISEKVSKLRTLGRVDIVTARPRETEEYAIRWLEHQGIEYDEYVWIRDGRSKLSLDYHVFIDDSPLMAEDAAHARKLVLLYDQPWNRSFRENYYVRRVRGLEEAYTILRRLREA